MKSLLLVLLSLCSPLLSQESSDYIDVVAPYPNRRTAHDRRAQSFLAGSHSPDTMKIFANMLYDYLKGVAVPHRNEEDYELEDANLKARNLELVQDAFEKKSLRHLATPPPYKGPPLPIGPPPPPPHSFNDYDIGAPGVPLTDSDRPLPPPMPKFGPIRYNHAVPSPIPPTSPPPSRVLLFKPSSLRQRPDEFIVRPPPHTRFNSPYGKASHKSAAAPILSINQMPYRRPFFIPLPPYSPPAYALSSPTVTTPYQLPAYRYRTDSRVETRHIPSERRPTGGYVLPPQMRKEEKKPYVRRQWMRMIYPNGLPVNARTRVPHSSQPIRTRYWRKNR